MDNHDCVPRGWTFTTAWTAHVINSRKISAVYSVALLGCALKLNRHTAATGSGGKLLAPGSMCCLCLPSMLQQSFTLIYLPFFLPVFTSGNFGMSWMNGIKSMPPMNG